MTSEPSPPAPTDTPEDPATTLSRCARLARLELAPGEAEALAPAFARVLEAFQTLSRWPLDVPDDAPAPGGTLRADEPRPGLERNDLLERAPEPLDGFYGVPKTIGGVE